MPGASPTLAGACPRCGRAREEQALACALCGELFARASRRREPDAAPATIGEPLAQGTHDSLASAAPVRARRDPREERLARLQPWAYLGLGLLSAPIFVLTPMLRFMGWFLASLVHEMGHSALAWLCGMPAFPAISLAGHAAAVHQGQSLVLVALIGCALLALAWTKLAGAARWLVGGAVLVLYPALALTDVKELCFLLAGHTGELAFATWCLWKTLDGGFTDSRLERALYGTLGGYLVGANLRLCLGLMTSVQARADYEMSGSFGLTNDYLRVAEEVLGWRLESVALLMLLATLAVVPAALALWRWRLGREAE